MQNTVKSYDLTAIANKSMKRGTTMIFADKLIQLRKQKGWSQEELAEKLDVTRQSVSKWESTQSVPDLERILRISEIFDVSLDYLLKDNSEKVEYFADVDEKSEIYKTISAEEAKEFIKVKKSISMPLAVAVFLCIISPICLLILGASTEKNFMSESMAGSFGVIILLSFIAAAVVIFLLCGSKISRYEYIQKEIIEIDSKTSEMVRNEKEDFGRKFVSHNIIGTVLLILSTIPLFCGVIIDEYDELLMTLTLSATIFLIAVGVAVFVKAGTVQSTFNMLLQEGEYSKDKKKRSGVYSAVTVSYWMIVTAVYLASSFLTKEWQLTWIVWAVAGVLYPALLEVVKLILKRK